MKRPLYEVIGKALGRTITYQQVPFQMMLEGIEARSGGVARGFRNDKNNHANRSQRRTNYEASGARCSRLRTIDPTASLRSLTRTKLKGHSKSFCDAAHSQFRFYIEYKAQREGGVVVRVDRWFASSKLCPTRDCDYKNDPLTLSDRSWQCPKCCVIHDRDINAALNILIEGMRMLAGGYPESENACDPYEDRSSPVAVLWRKRKSGPERGRRLSMNQEVRHEVAHTIVWLLPQRS